MYDLIIQHADLLQIDGHEARVLPGHALAIEAGRIAAIAPEISPGLGRERLDAKGMLAVPGFVNSHAHVPMGLFRGVAEDVTIDQWFNHFIWPMETNLTDDDVYWGAMLGIAEMIEAGVTCVADHYFAMGEVARAVDEAGMRALLAWTLFSGDTEAQSLERSAEFVGRWQGAGAGRIRTWLGPHSPYTCTPAFLAQIAGLARSLDVGVHIHLSETADQVALSRQQHGKSPVAVARDAGLFEVPTIGAHAAHLDDDDIAIFARHGVAIGSTPKTEMKLGIGVAPVVDLRARGVTVGLGSDGAGSSNSYDILEAARLLALLEKHSRRDPTALPVGEALALASREGARALGLAGVCGELRVGLQADIALIRRDSPHAQPLHSPAATLLYSATPADVDTVLVAGRLLMRERRLLTIDKGRVLREVAARAERLTRRRDGEQMAFYPSTS
jgi:5-methylthioadenosine/S-adenosylhomocysteine deaminase